MARSFLGLDATGAYALPGHFSVELPIGETFQRVMDRICLLESQVNWRLYGMPAAVGNVKLEQAGILANGLELENLVAHLAKLNARENEEKHFSDWLESLKKQNVIQRVVVVCSYSLVNSGAFQQAVTQYKNQIWFVADVEDLYLPAYEALIPRDANVLRAPLVSVLAGLGNEELTGAWLSDAHIRMHPLKWLLVLQQLERALSPKGKARGLSIPENNASKDVRSLKYTPATCWAEMAKVSALHAHDEHFELQK
jgi:hypothetical protein